MAFPSEHSEWYQKLQFSLLNETMCTSHLPYRVPPECPSSQGLISRTTIFAVREKWSSWRWKTEQRSTAKHKDTVGLTLNSYKDISSVWITNTIKSCAPVATLVLSSSNIQRHGHNHVARESGPRDVWFGKAPSCAVQIHFNILIHCLIFWDVIDSWWSCGVI